MEGNENALVGDLNVDVFNKADPNYAHLENVCAPFLLENVVQSPTRLTKCLDVILTNSIYVSSRPWVLISAENQLNLHLGRF